MFLVFHPRKITCKKTNSFLKDAKTNFTNQTLIAFSVNQKSQTKEQQFLTEVNFNYREGKFTKTLKIAFLYTTRIPRNFFLQIYGIFFSLFLAIT